MNRRILQYDVQPVGHMTNDKENGRVRIFFGQLNNMSMENVRKIKIKAIKYIEKKYDTDIDIYNEIGTNFTNSPKGLKFQDWMGDRGNTKCVMAYNKHNKGSTSLYQPGGTGIRVKGTMTQYFKNLQMTIVI